jgi:hypothetical protein
MTNSQDFEYSRGIVIDRPILDLLHIEDDAAFEVTTEKKRASFKAFISFRSLSEDCRETSKVIGQTCKMTDEPRFLNVFLWKKIERRENKKTG